MVCITLRCFLLQKKYLVRYRTEGNIFATTIQNAIDRNEKRIVDECQKYLDDYSEGRRVPFSTDIDLLLSILDSLS